VAVVDSNSDVSMTASAGYRFNRTFGLGVELTLIPSLPHNLPSYYPFVRIDNPGGSITVFTTNVRLEIPTTPAPIPDIRAPFTVSRTDLALTVGGGVSIVAIGNMTIDVDLRYLHLLGDEDQSIGRFGAGVSYRFRVDKVRSDDAARRAHDESARPTQT
jgi:opacity protein-like surface antigen